MDFWQNGSDMMSSFITKTKMAAFFFLVLRTCPFACNPQCYACLRGYRQKLKNMARNMAHHPQIFISSHSQTYRYLAFEALNCWMNIIVQPLLVGQDFPWTSLILQGSSILLNPNYQNFNSALLGGVPPVISMSDLVSYKTSNVIMYVCKYLLCGVILL